MFQQPLFPKFQVIGEYLTKFQYSDLEQLHPNPLNPKEHDLSAISASIKRFGYVEPVVVDTRTNKIVSGHGRVEQLQALKMLGQDPPEGIQVQDDRWLIPTVYWTSKNDTEANAYIIAANRTTELGGWNDQALNDLLTEISQSELGLEGIGFQEKDLVRFLAHLDQGDADQELLPERWSIIVKCNSERHQAELLFEFQTKGIECQAIMS